MNPVAQELKAKLLDLAIRGKLVKQDPNDEPASELLKRIAAGKAKLVTAKKIKKDKPLSVIDADEQPFDLPKGWAWCRLGKILLPTETKLPTGREFRYIDIDAIDNKRNIVTMPKQLKVSEAPSRASRGVQEGDILFSVVRPYLRNIAPIEKCNDDCIASTGFHVCRPCALCDQKYVLRLLLSDYLVMGLNSFMKGDNSPSIRLNHIVEFPIPLPPLAEQKRIVARLEELLAAVDKAGEGLEAIEDFEKKLRAKILDLAIRGKLVKQDPKDEPAAELLKRIAAEKAKLVAAKKIKKDKPLPEIAADEQPFDLPKGWAWCRISELGEFSGGHTPSMANAKFWNGNVPWVASSDMKQKYLVDTGKKVTKLGAAELKMLNPETIVLCTRSGILRRTIPVAIAKTRLTINQDQRALSLHLQEMSEYVYCALRALEDDILANYRKTGTTVESIIWEKFINLPIPLPPLAEQKRIVAKVEELLAACDALKGEV